MSCEHLVDAGDPAPQTTYEDGCPECVAGGFTGWVHLRLCLTCGVVACCDSSPRRLDNGFGSARLRSMPAATAVWPEQAE